MHIEPNASYNEDRMMQSLVYIAEDLFSGYKDLDFVLCFSIQSEREEGVTHQGCAIVYDENNLLLSVSIPSIREVSKAYGGYKTLRKNIMHTILHEMKHGLTYLYEWNKDLRLSLEDVYENINDEGKLYYNDSDEDYIFAWLNRKEELECERFAFKNISYFESIYDFDGLLGRDTDIKGINE